MTDIMRNRPLFAICKAAFCLFIACIIAPLANAQSYSEDMSMMAAQEFYDDVQRRISSATHDGPTYYLSRDYTLTPEQEQWLKERKENDERLDELRNDPVLMRLVNGSWEHYQSRESAAPGEHCAATYTNLDGLITLTSADKSWEGGLLVFMGKDIPKPRVFSEITATLTQSRGAPVTVRIFNLQSSPAMGKFGTLIFAVPSIKAALAGMRDEESFAVTIEGKEVFRMSWKGGTSARNSLRQCLNRK